MNFKWISGPVSADDLTGATDVASVLLAAGIPSCVIPWSSAKNMRLPPEPRDRVLTWDMDCRESSAAVVRKRIRHIAKLVGSQSNQPWYHKIDSGLRGTIRIQIQELMYAREPCFAIMAPANPRQNRTTRNGIHYIDGVPLARSPLRRDPMSPRRTSCLKRIIEPIPGAGLVTVRVDDVAKGVVHLRKLLSTFDDRLTLVLLDAMTEKHLRSIAHAALTLGLVVGSAGLARHFIALQVPRAAHRKEPHRISRLPKADPARTLIIAGSAAPATLRQNAALRDWAGNNIQLIAPPEFKRAHRDASPDRIRSTLLRRARKALDTAERIIVCGGQTTSDVCRVLGIEELIAIHALGPGVGVFLARGRRELLITVKPGSFGPPDFYRAACKAMERLG